MRIVIDTNIITSAMFYGGRPYSLIRLVLEKQITAVASENITDEYKEIADRFERRRPDLEANITLDQILPFFDIINVSSDIKVCRDPDDDKFISCAVDGKCIYIVSGDKDLLSLEKYEDVEILTIAEFFERYDSSI